MTSDQKPSDSEVGARGEQPLRVTIPGYSVGSFFERHKEALVAALCFHERPAIPSGREPLQISIDELIASDPPTPEQQKAMGEFMICTGDEIQPTLTALQPDGVIKIRPLLLGMVVRAYAPAGHKGLSGRVAFWRRLRLVMWLLFIR